MLGIVGTDAHSAGISVLNFNIDIADCGIERARVGVRRRRVRARASAREKQHIGRSLLKTWSVGGEHKGGTRGPEPDQPDSGPDIDGPAQTIAARGNEQDTLIGPLLNLIDGLL